MTTIALIAAVAENGVIGERGGMPWRLSADMKRFKALTMGKPVVMGRKTWESIGKPLTGRHNIVITRQAGYDAPGGAVVSSLEAALDLAAEETARAGVDEIFVIGGGITYREALPLADRLYITHVHASPDGDTRFPPIDPAAWTVRSQEEIPAGERDEFATTFVVYERRAAAMR